MPDYESKMLKLQMLTDFGDGLFIEPVRFFDYSQEEAVVVDPTYPENTHSTVIVKINGYIVLPSHRTDVDQAQAYMKMIPTALRAAGVFRDEV